MAAWLVYLTVVGCVVALAGLLVEGGLRHLGRSVRWSWAGAMALTCAFPIAAMAAPWPARLVTPTGWSAMVAGTGSSRVDVVLMVTWLTLSLVLLAEVRLSAWTLRRNGRSWRTAIVDHRPMRVSAGFGPGVVGAWRPWIVLPEWVLGAAPSLRRLIVLHEVEHVRARDTRLLLGGVILVALVPWCLPLWWQLHRLRGAIEMDCDARVLAATARPGDYARALVALAARRAHHPMPVAALAPRGGELERRIRAITAGAGERSRVAGLGSLAVAAGLVLGLGALSVPAPPGLSLLEAEATAGGPPRAASVYVSIERDPPERPASAR